MYNFIKKAFHLEKSEEIKIEDNYLKCIIFQAEKNCQNEKTLKHIKDIINSIVKKDKKTFRELCTMGIPEEVPLLRSIIWKINLKFLDLNVESWNDVIQKKRSEYNNMKEAFMIKMQIDKKIQEDSNSGNNIIRKNGDSINEEEESKDSSSKSKNNSKNNNSKSKLSNNNSHNNNLNFKENENKNVSDTKASIGIIKNQTFRKLNDINTNNNLENKDISVDKDLESCISKNQFDFSRNFLNLELDERKIKKNKKFISPNNDLNEINTFEKDLLVNQINYTRNFDLNKKVYLIEGNNNNSRIVNSNMTFNNINQNNDSYLNLENQENRIHTDISIHHNKVNISKKNDYNFLENPENKEDLNQKHVYFLNNNNNKLGSNKNLSKIPLPNKLNKIQNSNNDLINTNIMQTLTPQIKLNKNERDISNENKNRNKIDFKFSVFDFLNKNISNNIISSTSNKDEIENSNKPSKFLNINNNPKNNLITQSKDTKNYLIKMNGQENNMNENLQLKINTTKIAKNFDFKNSFEEKKESKKIFNKHETLDEKMKNKDNKADSIYKNLKKNTKLSNYEDQALIEEIYKDMRRTHSEYQFILKPTNFNKKEDLSNFQLEKILVERNKNQYNLNFLNSESNDDYQPETHLDVIARILYIFAKLNKNIRYVQGMNELVSLIYFVILQEEEFDKITSLMQLSNQLNKNYNKNEKNIINKNNNLINEDSHKNVKGNFAKNLDISNSTNGVTKLCDLARLEEAEEEKNIFDLNAERKSSNNLNKLIGSPVKDKIFNQNINNALNNNYKDNNYQNIINKDNAALNNLINMQYMESLNNHDELFGFTTNRLIKQTEKNLYNNMNSKKEDYNLEKISNKPNIFYTPDISKDKFMGKFNLKPSNLININNCNIDNLNNNQKINNNEKNIISSAVTDRKIKSNKVEEKTKNLNKNYDNNLKNNNELKIERDYEADTFWCFCYLMDQLKYIYLRSEDNKERGIMKKIQNLNVLLKMIDKNLSLHLESISVDITLFSFKWIILLFAQNFNLPDVIRIWDILLLVESPNDIFYKVYYFALAIFEYKRNKIIGKDFPAVVLQLQNLNDIYVENLIVIYKRIMKENVKKVKKALGY